MVKQVIDTVAATEGPFLAYNDIALYRILRDAGTCTSENDGWRWQPIVFPEQLSSSTYFYR